METGTVDLRALEMFVKLSFKSGINNIETLMISPQTVPMLEYNTCVDGIRLNEEMKTEFHFIYNGEEEWISNDCLEKEDAMDIIDKLEEEIFSSKEIHVIELTYKKDFSYGVDMKVKDTSVFLSKRLAYKYALEFKKITPCKIKHTLISMCDNAPLSEIEMAETAIDSI